MQQANIVSDPTEQLILVDSDDQEIGVLAKADCHKGAGVLHRAFSVFLFNSSGEILLQRRSAEKPLWPMYWSNACCSHPRSGETMEVALQRRLLEELGIQCPLTYLYKFQYQAGYGHLGAEHEVCSVYRGTYDGTLHINESEIADTRFVEPAALVREVSERPEDFTPWFKLELAEIATYSDELVPLADGD